MSAANLDHLLGHGHGNDHCPVIVRHDDVARHDEGVGAGDRHVDGEGKNIGLGVEIGRDATNPEAEAVRGDGGDSPF